MRMKKYNRVCPLCGSKHLTSYQEIEVGVHKVTTTTFIECNSCKTRSPETAVWHAPELSDSHPEELLDAGVEQCYDIWLYRIRQVGLREARDMINGRVDPTQYPGRI